MRIGIPREVKDGERRVALTPSGARDLSNVVFEPGAGVGAGFSDDDYRKAGAQPGDPWACEVVVKVKELQESEYRKPRRGQTILCFQHFGPHAELLDAALASGATFIAYETVGEEGGRLPILAPMSAIAGALAVQAGAWCLQQHNGGSGVLLPGVAGVAPGRVVILGAGNAGGAALAVAHGMGAGVAVFAKSEKRFAALRARYPAVAFRAGLDEGAIRAADLVIGAVLTPGQMSPQILSRAMVRAMKPGSALVDIGIDQGGIAETSRPTSHSKPVYVEEGVVHYCVPNMPAACAHTASLALEHAVSPFIREILDGKFSPDLQTGIQVKAGKVTHAHLARDTRRPYSPL